MDHFQRSLGTTRGAGLSGYLEGVEPAQGDHALPSPRQQQLALRQDLYRIQALCTFSAHQPPPVDGEQVQAQIRPAVRQQETLRGRKCQAHWRYLFRQQDCAHVPA